ncbi:MAG: radical SAM protein [Lachnospiraceae bacterium]|nr:radical SAM protein [Lachnospiraceae bacterium]
MKFSLCDDFLNSKKIIYPLFRYGEEYLNGRTDFAPWAVEIHPTAKCNYRCIHCSYKERNENRSEMSKEMFEQLIDSLISMGVKGVYFSGGGEPTAFPYLAEQIRKLHDNGVEVSLISNASLFDKMGIIDVLDCINYTCISVPSCNREMFKKITGKDTLEEVLAIPQRAKDKFGDAACIMGSRVVVTNLIADEVPSILKTLKERNFDYANFKIVRDYESRGLGLSEEAVSDLKIEIDNLSASGEMDHRFTNVDKVFEYRKPYKPVGTCHINKMGLLAVVTPEGDVYPNISEIGMKDFLVGNLSDAPFEKLWNGSRHQIVKENSKKRWCAGKCQNCRSISYNEKIESIISGVPKNLDPFV